MMYNRYVPQPDGSYRRDRVTEKQPAEKPEPPKARPEDPCPPPPTPPSPPREACHEEPRQICGEPNRSTGAGDFLRQLLPKNLDTGDLIVILLLLLMAGDCQDDRNIALLTLAIYLFM